MYKLTKNCKKVINKIFLLLLLVFCSSIAHSMEFSTAAYAKKYGEIKNYYVDDVHDGDTFKAVVSGKIINFRLYGADAPEVGQPYADEAKDVLTIALEAAPTIVFTGKKSYNRPIVILVVGGIIVNELLVKNGLAWYDDRYAKNYKKLYVLQENARKNKWGLWADEKPIEPKIWRSKKRK